MRRLAAMIAGFVMIGSLCFADSIAVTPVNPYNVVSDPNQNFTIGWQFTVTSPVTVTELGYYDPAADGELTSNHEVGIFGSDGSLLLSAIITAGKYNTEDGFAFVSVPSFTLGNGTYVIGGGSFDSSDLFIFSASSLAPIPQITLGKTGLFTFGSVFTLPVSNAASATYMGPDFEVASAAAVPESSSLPMLICATLSLAFAGFIFQRKPARA